MARMQISDYSYTLPEDRIAYYPPSKRGNSRLLVLDRGSGTIEHRRYAELSDYLKSGDVVVLNDTKVIKARLSALNSEGGHRELLLLEQHGNSKVPLYHRCLVRGKVHKGDTLQVGDARLHVEDTDPDGIAVIRSESSWEQLSEQHGNVPLPPYIKRTATPEDERRYQTVFAKQSGSVAAPTASLNFTKDLQAELIAKGVKVVYMTLHVGLGTFLPIRSETVEEHTMHSEYFEIPQATAEAIAEAKQTGKAVCAVGTTVVRTLEYCAQQLTTGSPTALSGEADIFIYPGYEFKIVDKLVTNFHAPKSTVLMLAAAFAGWDNLQKAYQEALSSGYRFLSYGDSMLINGHVLS